MFHKKPKSEAGFSKKQMSVWMLIFIDVLLAAVCLGAFSFYQIVLPKKLSSAELVVATTTDLDYSNFTLPDNNGTENNNIISVSPVVQTKEFTGQAPTNKPSGKAPTDNPSRVAQIGNFSNYGNTDTDNISANESDIAAFSNKLKTITEMNTYQSDNIQFTTNMVELGSGNDKVTYYISDIYVTNVKYIKTAFAKGTYARNITDSSLDMAAENGALLTISGDYYGNSEISIVIRNGILYRSTGNDADVCILFTDGTMKTYSPEDFDADEVIDEGAWQAWTFGPALLDGNGDIPGSFHTTDYLYGYQPRSAIGYIEQGHYVFVIVDGRCGGYSRGANLNELAQIMVDAGCVSAYNLDGGKSASMVYNNEYVNIPAQGGRDISDIIYLGE